MDETPIIVNETRETKSGAPVLIGGILAAAVAGYIESPLSLAALTVPLITFNPAPGVIYGVVVGSVLALLAPALRVSRVNAFFRWLLVGTLSWCNAYLIAFFTAGSLGGFNFFSPNPSGVIVGIATGGLVGAFILGVGFNSISDTRIRLIPMLAMGLTGSVIAVLYSTFFSLGNQTYLITGMAPLFITWQTIITGVLFYHFLEENSPWRRVSIGIGGVVVVAILIGIALPYVSSVNENPTITVQTAMNQFIASNNFPSGTTVQIRLSNPNKLKDVYDRYIYPINYWAYMSYPPNNQLDPLNAVILNYFDHSQDSWLDDQCTGVDNEGRRIGVKNINTAFTLCYNLDFHKQGMAYFDGYIDTKKRMWVEMTVGPFTNLAPLQVPTFITYATGYTNTQFIADITSMGASTGVEFPNSPLVIQGSTPNTVHRGDVLSYFAQEVPATDDDMASVLVPEAGTSRTSLKTHGYYSDYFYDDIVGGYQVDGFSPNGPAAQIPLHITIPQDAPNGAYHVSVYLLPHGFENAQQRKPINSASILATSTPTFIIN